MPKLFQYGRSASNQGSGIMSKMISGINEYLPANTINDALMSDEIDVYPYREECVLFNADATVAGIDVAQTKGLGYVRVCIHSDESTTDKEVFYLMTSLAASWKIVKHTYVISTDVTTLHSDTMTMGSVPADPTLVDSSSAIFKVEADTYYVFSNTHEKRIHFIKHTSTGDSYSYVDVPAYPKKMVAHASRVFFIDTENKIWWCRAGDLYSWYSMEYDADAITTTRNCANAAYAIAAQPTTTRQVTATVTRVSDLDTLGVLTIVGTSGLDAAQAEILTLLEGRVQSSKAFKTITSATQSGWTIGGTTADTIVVGVAPVGLGFVTDDAGYWTLEQELYLHDICVLGNAMYIFTDHNIYTFQGYSPDTFSLSKIISDIGIERMEAPSGYRKLTTGKNVAYFIYDGLLYEFDGNNQPRIMSRPLVVNNQSSNGIMGGIDFAGESWVVQAIADALCLYDYSGDTDYFYFYRFETKTWWKRSGFGIGNIAQFTPAVVSNPIDAEILVVAGGGTGVTGAQGAGGGGGGGVVHETVHSITVGEHAIVVGTGGSGASHNGGNSTLDTIVAYGGGAGSFVSGVGSDGGSGGGGSWYSENGGSGIAGQGYAGGRSSGLFSGYMGGGGGGAGAVGGNAVADTRGGLGGDGLAFTISGASAYYAGGGGGWGGNAAGGVGGGGTGYIGGAGTPNTGGGGGGGYAGGSGVVIIRYLTGNFIATGGVKTVDGFYTVHTFIENGTFTLPDYTAAEIDTTAYYTSTEDIKKILYVPAFNRQEWFSFVSITSDTLDYVYSNQQGCTQGTALPFFVTKAFNTNPSETGSLTEVVLAIKGTVSETADIKVRYSLTVDGNDFADIKTYTGHVFTGDLEIISIPVPISQIANAHHYRIKVEIGNCSDAAGVYLYNIERRFRVKGRSR